MSPLERIKYYIHVSNVAAISRRYFVMNAFDGVMTILGIVIAAYFAGAQNPSWLISAGLGACIAMGISGFSGAYLTEESEKHRELIKLEKSMLKKLKNTVIDRASKFASFWAAFVDGLSPTLGALISLMPFFLSLFGLLNMKNAIFISIGISLTVLFMLGMYMGKISHRNILINGLKAIFAGLAVAVILFLLNLF